VLSSSSSSSGVEYHALPPTVPPLACVSLTAAAVYTLRCAAHTTGRANLKNQTEHSSITQHLYNIRQRRQRAASTYSRRAVVVPSACQSLWSPLSSRQRACVVAVVCTGRALLISQI